MLGTLLWNLQLTRTVFSLVLNFQIQLTGGSAPPTISGLLKMICSLFSAAYQDRFIVWTQPNGSNISDIYTDIMTKLTFCF